MKFKVGDRVVLLEQDANVYTVGEIRETSKVLPRYPSYEVYLLFGNHYYDLKPYENIYYAPESRLRMATLADIANVLPLRK